MSTGYTTRPYTAASPIRRGMLLKKSTTGGKVAPLAVGDDPVLCIGVAGGDAFTGHALSVDTLRGADVQLYSDGAATIAEGDELSPSDTVDGAVMSDTGNVVAIANQGAPATVGALVGGLWMGAGGGGGSSGYPAPSTTADAVSAGAIAVDGTILNTLHLVALSANATLAVTGPVAGETYRFKVTNAGAFNITWPAAFKWPGGVAPTMTASGVDLVTADYDGTNYNATASQAIA